MYVFKLTLPDKFCVEVYSAKTSSNERFAVEYARHLTLYTIAGFWYRRLQKSRPAGYTVLR
jgi:hypothetical protein